MSTLASPTPPTVGAAVQPDTEQVLARISTAGQRAHHIAPPPQCARNLAARLIHAAETAEQLHRNGGDDQ